MINTKIEPKEDEMSRKSGQTQRNDLCDRRISRRGTAYVEYFLVATGMALATVWLVGRLGSAVGPYNTQFNSQMATIRGGVR